MIFNNKKINHPINHPLIIMVPIKRKKIKNQEDNIKTTKTFLIINLKTYHNVFCQIHQTTKNIGC